MKTWKLSFLLIPAIALATATTLSGAATSVGADGLVQVKVRNLDEVYLNPQADLAKYRRVLIDAPKAELQRGWVKSINAQRDVTRWLTPQDAQNIVDVATATLGSSVAMAFTEKGYEVVTAPGPGVLRITPRVSELYINAPDTHDPGIQRSFVRDDAGTATLQMDARDAVSGVLLARVVDRGTAREVMRINRATSVSNQFWFEAMFRTWAANCAGEFLAANPLP
jgi:hypothetical protein